MREKHHVVASHVHPDWGLNLLPRCVPWLGIEPLAFWRTGRCPNRATPARVVIGIFNMLPRCFCCMGWWRPIGFDGDLWRSLNHTWEGSPRSSRGTQEAFKEVNVAAEEICRPAFRV